MNDTASIPTSIDLATATRMRDAALVQLTFARNYTLELLKAIPHELWLTIPTGGSSHVLWQVGHIAVAEYGLLLFRMRGRAEIDLELVPGRFRKGYGRGSKPSIDADQPSPAEMMSRLTMIHDLGMRETQSGPAERLLEPIDMPYAGYANKLGSLLFAPMHEMIHAGQIGVLRRQLGLEPIR